MDFLEFLKNSDQKLFLFLNDLHNSFFDVLMYWVTDKYFWIPFYLFLIGVIICKYKWHAIYFIIIVIVAVIVSDQLTSAFMKPFFERLRPCHDPVIGSLVHTVRGCGGSYGFASSHAANTFGVSIFLWLLLKPHFKMIWWLFVWAAVVSYSRIYVGVHYPGDILVGAMVGILVGYIFFVLQQKIASKIDWLPDIKRNIRKLN